MGRVLKATTGSNKAGQSPELPLKPGSSAGRTQREEPVLCKAGSSPPCSLFYFNF